jgi:H+/Cl- antiporter ClcA
VRRLFGARSRSQGWEPASAPPWRHVAILLGAGMLTGLGQIVLRRLTSGNGIDITEAISLHAGRMPALRTLGSAVLSILVVGMGVSLGREGAPKQAGADRHKPTGGRRLIAPVVALGLIGVASISYPQLLGNGKDIAQLAWEGAVA